MAPKTSREPQELGRVPYKTGQVPKASAAQQGGGASPTMPSGRAPWNHPLPPPRPPWQNTYSTTPPHLFRQADALVFPGIYILPEEVPRFFWECNALPISYYFVEEENLWYVYCICLTPHVIAPGDEIRIIPQPPAALQSSGLPPAQAVSPLMSAETPPTAIPVQTDSSVPNAPPSPHHSAGALRSDPYMDTPSLSPSQAASPSHSQTVPSSPRAQLRGSMWPFQDDSEDDRPMVRRTPSPVLAPYSPPPEFSPTQEFSPLSAYSPPPPPQSGDIFPGWSPVVRPKRARMGNQSLPPPKKLTLTTEAARPPPNKQLAVTKRTVKPCTFSDIRLQGNATMGGSSSHEAESPFDNRTIGRSRLQAPGNRNASNAASATQGQDNQDPAIGVTASTRPRVILPFGCPCADCYVGDPPRTKAKSMSDEHIMHLHEVHREQTRLRSMWRTGGRNAVRAAKPSMMIPVQNPDPRPRIFSPHLRWAASLPPPGPPPPPLPPSPPQAESPLLLQHRTLQDIIDSGGLGVMTQDELDLMWPYRTSPTELAPESVRSSDSQFSPGPGGEPEQEPPSGEIPSISSPPDDIYLL